MQTYDIVMIAVLAVATIFGAIKGLAWQIASLASIVVSYTVAYTFRNDVAKMIRAQEPWNGFLAMLLLYAGTSFVIWVGFRLISGAIDRVRLKDFDRHMGALLGLGKGVVYCMLITMFAVSLLGPKQQQAIVDSKSGGYMSKIFAAPTASCCLKR
jgi:membrane protein required for colicin V production